MSVGVARPRSARDLFSARWLPVVATVISAVLFLILQPNVNDLQAALSRQSAAAHGVGLTYWFSWFSGGATPGQYSLLTPYLTDVFTVAGTAAIAALLTVLLTQRAVRDLPYAQEAVWAATLASSYSMWQGRVPFALGTAATVVVAIGFRERRTAVLLAGAVVSVTLSPVSGAFIAFGLATVFLVDHRTRRLSLYGCVTALASLIVVAIVFGSPGPEGFSLIAAAITSAAVLIFLVADPPAEIRLLCLFAAVGSLLLVTFPNGMGSNFSRLVWIVLPPLVVATARAPRRLAVFAVIPALAMGCYFTVQDLYHSHQPASTASYYRPLGQELDRLPDMKQYRLEVVQDDSEHTGAYALLSHASLARGWETQEDNQYNSVLKSRATLNAISYKVWLDDNAVGYVALGTKVVHNQAEHNLVARGNLPYLHRVWSNPDWVLYRVSGATPIVAPPQRVVSSTQSQLVVQVRCTCRFPIRLRYSKFLQAATVDGRTQATVTDDGTGWTDVRVPRPGRYVLKGKLVGPFH